MNPAVRIPRLLGVFVLAILSIACSAAARMKSRLFNAPFDAVWAAATDIAKESFLPDQERTSKEQGKLGFRTGPFRGYRFEVFLVNQGVSKTRVDVELRTNRYGVEGVEKDAWRSCDWYLSLLGQRLQPGGRK